MDFKKGKRHEFKKEEISDKLFESDETFSFIAGYASNGFPYGITWEEMKEIEVNEAEEKEVEDIELPF